MDLKPLKTDKDISQPWLEEMLSRKKGCKIKVTFWSSTLPKGREGFLSEIAFVKVQYVTQGGEEEEIKLVFKFLPNDANLVNFLSNGGLAKREVEFYQFASSVDIQAICERSGIVLPVPEIYYSSYTDDAITIVLRDLNVDHYKSVIVKDGSSLAQTKTALQQMAVIHGAGILYLQQHGQDKGLSSLVKEFNNDFLDQFFIPNLKTLAEMYAGSSLAKFFKAFIPLTKHIRTISSRYPFITTVIHGDLWAGQLLYSADESTASVIDWQFFHLDNLVVDIMSMFFMSTDPLVLEEHLEDILKDYWSALTKVIEQGGSTMEATLEQLIANVEDMWMHGFMFLAASIHDFLGADNISQGRLLGTLSFLEKRGVFSRFLAEFENKVM